MGNSLWVLSQDSFIREVSTFSGDAPSWRDQDADTGKGYTGLHFFLNEKEIPDNSNPSCPSLLLTLPPGFQSRLFVKTRPLSRRFKTQVDYCFPRPHINIYPFLHFWKLTRLPLLGIPNGFLSCWLQGLGWGGGDSVFQKGNHLHPSSMPL